MYHFKKSLNLAEHYKLIGLNHFFRMELNLIKLKKQNQYERTVIVER